MHKITLVYTLLLASTQILFSQKIDSLKTVLSSSKSIKTKALVAANLGHIYSRRNYDSAIFYLQKSQKMARDQHNQILELRAINLTGMTHAMHGHLDLSLNKFYESKDLSIKWGLDSALAQARFGLGNVLEASGQYNASLEEYLEALRYFEQHDNLGQANSTKANMAYIYRSLKQIAKAKALILETNAYYEKANDKSRVMNGLSRIASIYAEEKSLDSALYFNLSALQLAEELEDDFSKVQLQINVGRNFIDLKQYAQAIQYLNASLALREQVGGNEEDLMFTYCRLATAYAMMRNWKMSQIFRNKADSLSQQINYADGVMDFYAMSFLLDSIAGDYLSAIDNYQKFKIVEDSIDNVEKSKQLAELQTQYETEKKDNEIASLSQQAQIQALEIRQRNLMLLGLGVVLLILVGGGVFYYQWRKLRFQQSVESLEQRMLRLQMNPHFIFNALAAIQSYILQSKTRESVSYLARFGKLMRQILEHSREEFITISEEADMLSNYLAIQQLRFNNSFEFEIIIDENTDASETRIPPLFAQPFVENAIEHGLKDYDAGGRVIIRFKKLGNTVLLEVEDNGSGFEKETVSGSHKSLATVIAKERLSIFEKQIKGAFGVTLDSSDQGALVKLSLPVCI